MKRVLTYLVIMLAAISAISLGYGIYRFPDAPIRQCGDDCYRGKRGQVHTVSDYEAFRRWLVFTPSVLVLTFILGFILNAASTPKK